ncbi:S8 family serine peptidase [Haliangium sp.]|uniref:S8 family serine peptidase n=1 Tax=Haliangium sp. TaxID=2663208 RepID=UPI003D09CDB6
MRFRTCLDILLAAGAAAVLLLPGCQLDQDATFEQSDEALAGPRAGDVISGQYIVVFREEAVEIEATADYGLSQARAHSAAAALLNDHGLSAQAIEHSYGKALRGFAARMNPAEASRLAADPRVKYVEPDTVVTLLAPPCHVTGTCDPGGGGGQTVPYGIARVGGGTTTSNATAWIIDTGVDFDHEDLNVDVGRSTGFVRNGTGDDGNGHGTHVAGTIAAIDNNVGVVGVAPGSTVVAVQVLSKSGSGSTSGVIAGVDYVAANASNGDVANMSLGGGVSQSLDDAVVACAASGVKIALAAGNESDDANNHSPARANHPNIYTVSAIDSSDRFASFSNFGNPPVDFAAPGVSVESTYKGNGYATLSGTSMAAPHVAGLLLLGNVRSDGNAIGDPDGNADPIAHN